MYSNANRPLSFSLSLTFPLLIWYDWCQIELFLTHLTQINGRDAWAKGYFAQWTLNWHEWSINTHTHTQNQIIFSSSRQLPHPIARPPISLCCWITENKCVVWSWHVWSLLPEAECLCFCYHNHLFDSKFVYNCHLKKKKFIYIYQLNDNFWYVTLKCSHSDWVCWCAQTNMWWNRSNWSSHHHENIRRI